MSDMAALVAGRPYTRADLAQTPDDGRRYELIDGVMVVSAARARFERAGIPSYWIVDPISRPAETALVVWELSEDGSYRRAAKAVGDEQVVLTQPYPVTIVPADLVR